MTLFQSILQTLLGAFAEFLPIGEGAHRQLLISALDWPTPSPATTAALFLGAAFASFAYFWADWASMLSSLLQLALFRRKPRTLDEKLPLFIAIAALPPMIGWIYLRPLLPETLSSEEWTGGLLVAGALAYGLSERFSRKNKHLYDWNSLDALVMGIFQLAWLIPGGGRIWGASLAAFLRNHARESTAKFAIYVSFPVLSLQAAAAASEVTWGMPHADLQETSWWIFALCAALALFASLLSINTFLKLSRSEGLQSWIRYRAVLGLGFIGLFVWKSFFR
jgi:undecaprenyl pyrophosphate phosphatase UppP